MAKIKSVKFYNFTPLSNSCYQTFNVKFYNELGRLIIIDCSNYIEKSDIHYEDQLLIVDANNYQYSWGSGQVYGAIHTGNFNKNVGMSKSTSLFYCPIDQNSIITFYFKKPQYLSDIQILHSMFGSDQDGSYGINTCDCDIIYDDETVETYNYVSNGEGNYYGASIIHNNSYDQSIMDSQFDSIEFSKAKQIYDSEIGLIETLDTNNFRNIPVNTVEKLRVLYAKPDSTILNCLVSFDKKQTWKTFNGNNWIEISDISGENIILNCMGIDTLDGLNKNQLILGGFTGDLDFKIVMKSNNENKTPSVSKIYIEYK